MAITYELKFALENIPDPDLPPAAGVMLPPLTHVVFSREYLTADDMLAMIDAVGSLSALTEADNVVKAARVILPRASNLSEAYAPHLSARDFMGLVEVMSPFFEF